MLTPSSIVSCSGFQDSGPTQDPLSEVEELSLVVVTADLSSSLPCLDIQASVEARVLPEGGQ